MRVRPTTLLPFVAIALLLTTGCQRLAGSAATGGPTPGSGNAAGPSGDLKTFSIKGQIVTVDRDKGSVLLDAEAVPGFMEAMTMSYKLHDPAVAKELHPGDRIFAQLQVHKTSDGYADPELDQIVVTAQAKPDYKPAVQYHIPAPGDQVPDFAFTNENGQTIHLDQFRGKVLLLTFIYTRCPLADYCVRMSRNFAQIDQDLKKDPKLYDQTHLLSISFDPKYDTPKVLKSYGGSYTGQYTHERFTHWDFAVPPAKELSKVLEWFGVGVTPGQGSTLTHSLSTAVVGPNGKIVAWYPSNDWSPAQALAAIRTAA